MAENLNRLPSADAPQAALERLDRLRRVAPALQHDINNAMMVLAANLDLLARSAGEPGSPARRQLDRAVQASRRMDETMRGFLDYARREAAETVEVSPATVLQQVLPLLRAALGARLGAEMTAPERPVAVRLDRAALELALLAVAQDAVGRIPQGSRLLAEVREVATEVELELILPLGVGTAPLALLRACCARLDLRPEGCVMAWRKEG
ncbi:histidine kinase dimerization/phospho-acceptor domain-containing protein [Falsiroseomonas sp. E2-1-a4]|uniref:histidine kinase dimerization/phospho-acceptor domain-containing protein n=1 Tax=Falsiroseomonas sp. E2-1-a4 TaxID=3239299 RepID=UPI003F415523